MLLAGEAHRSVGAEFEIALSEHRKRHHEKGVMCTQRGEAYLVTFAERHLQITRLRLVPLLLVLPERVSAASVPTQTPLSSIAKQAVAPTTRIQQWAAKATTYW